MSDNGDSFFDVHYIRSAAGREDGFRSGSQRNIVPPSICLTKYTIQKFEAKDANGGLLPVLTPSSNGLLNR
jgi:hypothetical protein